MNRIQIYQDPNGETQIEVQFDQETVWLNQEQLGVLFERDRTVIGRHIKNIFKERELEEEVVSADFAHTTKHGAIKNKSQLKTQKVYNLDVIISVGYRVKSKRGTQFRIWATNKLRDLLAEGYIINQHRLEQKEQEVKFLKSGIHILSRAIEQKALDSNLEWLN